MKHFASISCCFYTVNVPTILGYWFFFLQVYHNLYIAATCLPGLHEYSFKALKRPYIYNMLMVCNSILFLILNRNAFPISLLLIPGNTVFFRHNFLVLEGMKDRNVSIFLYRGRRTNDRIIPRWEERFINAFSSNLNPVDLKIFPNHSGIFISRWSRHNSIELWKDLFLRYIVKKFWRVCHVQFPSCWTWPGLLIHYLKINTRNSELNLKKHFVHYVSGGGYYMQSLPSFLISLLVVCC